MGTIDGDDSIATLSIGYRCRKLMLCFELARQVTPFLIASQKSCSSESSEARTRYTDPDEKLVSSRHVMAGKYSPR
jgi:hypothetical protein